MGYPIIKRKKSLKPGGMLIYAGHPGPSRPWSVAITAPIYPVGWAPAHPPPAHPTRSRCAPAAPALPPAESFHRGRRPTPAIFSSPPLSLPKRMVGC